MRAVIVTLTLSLFVRGAMGCTGYGAVVKTDAWTYTSSDATKEEYHVSAGTYLTWNSMSGYGERKCKNGLCRVMFLRDNKEDAAPRITWARESDFAVFKFEGGNEIRGGWYSGQTQCKPFDGITDLRWTVGFLVSAEEKCKDLGVTPPDGKVLIVDASAGHERKLEDGSTSDKKNLRPATAVPDASTTPPAHQPAEAASLKNGDVIGMVQAGLDNEIVIEKLKMSNVDFDVSVTGLVDLQKAKVPPEIIKAMIERPKGLHP